MLKEPITLDRILSLPEEDIKALQQGNSIAALPIFQVQKGWNFLLHAHSQSDDVHESVIESWATCVHFQIIHDQDKFDLISKLTSWNKSELERLFQQRGHLALALLKVYRLPVALSLRPAAIAKMKIGCFIGLTQIEESLKSPLRISAWEPVLSDKLFTYRRHQLQKFQLPEHPELEELQSTIAHYAKDYPEAQDFSDDLQEFLGWTEPKGVANRFPNWISEITTSGNSSDGYLFEKRVRQAFIQLGFTNTFNNALDPEAMGGAGGIDIYCEKPFAIVGECKASGLGNVGNGVAAQLINLGNANLGKSQFESAVKIIFAAGKLNTIHAEPAAKENQMNVMRPNTLERLIKIQVAHPGSIDLLELKPCLEAEPFGTEADKKINDFIDKIEQRIKIRSHIVGTFKKLVHDKNLKEISFEKFCGILYASHPPEDLKDRDIYNIMIELSSPLTGHLGRISCEGKHWRSDRFYFLRDLTV